MNSSPPILSLDWHSTLSSVINDADTEILEFCPATAAISSSFKRLYLHLVKAAILAMRCLLFVSDGEFADKALARSAEAFDASVDEQERKASELARFMNWDCAAELRDSTASVCIGAAEISDLQ